jgi:hypothetical protein
MKKIVTIHQPNYIPWLGFFHKLFISDIYVAFDDVQFEKNSYNNRNKIKTSHGDYWLTVPIITKGKSKETLINNAQIDNKQNWAKKHLKNIQSNYSKSKFYEDYIWFFEETFDKNWEILSDLNMHILRWILKELKIDTKIVVSSDLKNKDGKKDELVLNICKIFKANIYVSGVLGKNYLNIDNFKKEGIYVYFQEYKHPKYSQLWEDFIPNMSIIDLLFNNGKESKKIIMQGNINKEQIAQEKIL